MSEPSKPNLIVRIPTPLWLIGLVLVALGVDRLVDTGIAPRHWPTGVGIIAVGLALSAWGRLTFAAARAEIKPFAVSNPRLVTHGPFRFTRNPMYLGITIIGIGAAVAAGTLWMWAVPIVLFALDHFVIIPFEERNMERQFGAAFRDYCAEVRRWI